MTSSRCLVVHWKKWNPPGPGFYICQGGSNSRVACPGKKSRLTQPPEILTLYGETPIELYPAKYTNNTKQCSPSKKAKATKANAPPTFSPAESTTTVPSMPPPDTGTLKQKVPSSPSSSPFSPLLPSPNIISNQFHRWTINLLLPRSQTPRPEVESPQRLSGSCSRTYRSSTAKTKTKRT